MLAGGVVPGFDSSNTTDRMWTMPHSHLFFLATQTSSPKTRVSKHCKGRRGHRTTRARLSGFPVQLQQQCWLIENDVKLGEIIRAHFDLEQQPEISIKFTQIREKFRFGIISFWNALLMHKGGLGSRDLSSPPGMRRSWWCLVGLLLVFPAVICPPPLCFVFRLS